VPSSALIDTVKAHSSTVWSVHLSPDGKVLASGSADKEVKFWEFEHDATPEDEVLQFFLGLAALLKILVESSQETTCASTYAHPQDV
jgi:WD40 repeat protein